MTVRTTDAELIALEGKCPSEEAEMLLQRLLSAPEAVVDLQHCESLHAAVIQVLLASERTLQLPPTDTAAGIWLRSVLLPAVTD
jgi:hypothetical protein